MFEELTIGQILRDFKSIKLRIDLRRYIDRMRLVFEATGDLPAAEKVKIRKMSVQYSRQMAELQDSRQRARRTNGLKAMGISAAEAGRRVEQRQAEKNRNSTDVGF